MARFNVLTECAATYLAARALSPLLLGLCRTTGPWLYFQMCAIAQLTKMLIKQQLTGAEKRTYTHLEEKVELQNQAGLVNRNIKKELCFCVTALL